jgi:hypothetical protein
MTSSFGNDGISYSTQSFDISGESIINFTTINNTPTMYTSSQNLNIYSNGSSGTGGGVNFGDFITSTDISCNRSLSCRNITSSDAIICLDISCNRSLSCRNITSSGTINCGTNTLTCGAITSSGSINCSTNTLTCGAITSSGTINCGTNTLTCGFINSSGTINCGSNSLTCGDINSSGTLNCGTNTLTCGDINSSGTLNCDKSFITNTINAADIFCDTISDLNSGLNILTNGNGYIQLTAGATTLRVNFNGSIQLTSGTTTLFVGEGGNSIKFDGKSSTEKGIFRIGQAYMQGFAGDGYLRIDGGVVSVVGISSITIKENVTPLSEDRYNMNNFLQIKPVLYNFISDEKKEKKLGFIAENFHELNFHELVFYNNENDKNKPTGIDYLLITPFIVKIVQEQQTQIESQQRQINYLKEEIQILKDLVNNIITK